MRRKPGTTQEIQAERTRLINAIANENDGFITTKEAGEVLNISKYNVSKYLRERGFKYNKGKRIWKREDEPITKKDEDEPFTLTLPCRGWGESIPITLTFESPETFMKKRKGSE